MRDYIFIDQSMEDMKKRLNTTKKPVYRRLIKQCDSYFSVSLPENHPASSTTWTGIAIANLSLAWLLSDDEKYLNEARRWIHCVVSWPHWGNARLVDVDLSAAWILFGLGIAFDWLKNDLPEAETEALRDKIILQSRRMYTFKTDTEGSGWSTNYWQNHNWINMCGLAAAGYALSADFPGAREWTDAAKKNFDFVYSVLPEDGSDYEGVVYWRYGAMWLYVYAHLLKEREGINHFETCGFLKNSFWYRLYQAAPNLEEQMNFGDCHDRRSGHSTAVYYKTAAEYGNGYAQKLGNLVRDEFLLREAELSKVKPGILPECFFEMIFYDESVAETDFDNLPLTRFFDDLGLYVNRSSWNRDATLLTIKCSRPGGRRQWEWLWKLKKSKGYDCFGLSHQHPDNNSFLIHSDGQYIAVDDGYNRSVRASDHNVILVDGQGYEGEGVNNIWKNHSAEMYGDTERCEIKSDHSYFSGETAAVYRKELALKVCRRHLLHTGRSWYFMADELKSAQPHIYTWQMHSDVHPEIHNSRYRFSLPPAEFDVYHYCDKPAVYKLDEHTVKAVMTTQEPDKFTENHMKSLLISNTEKACAMSFLSVFVPLRKGAEELKVRRVQGRGVWGVAVRMVDYSETFLLSAEADGEFDGKTVRSKITLFKQKRGGKSEVIRY